MYDPHDDPGPTQDTLDGLAEIITSGNLDQEIADRLVDATEFFLRPHEVRYFRLAMDRCPIHGCDPEICADDNNPECVVERTLAKHKP